MNGVLLGMSLSVANSYLGHA